MAGRSRSMRIPTYEDFLEEAASELMLNKGVRMGQMKKGLPEIVAPGIGREPHTDPACRFPWEGVAVTTPRPACGSTQGSPGQQHFPSPSTCPASRPGCVADSSKVSIMQRLPLKPGFSASPENSQELLALPVPVRPGQWGTAEVLTTSMFRSVWP